MKFNIGIDFGGVLSKHDNTHNMLMDADASEAITTLKKS